MQKEKQSINKTINMGTYDKHQIYQLIQRKKQLAPLSHVVGIELMRLGGDRRITDKIVRSITRDHCNAWKQQSRHVATKSIRQFIKNFNIDWRKASRCQGLGLEDCIKQYTSLNDFFTRNITPQPHVPNDNSVIVSPAQCRLVCYNTVSEATRFWVKGRRFSISKLLNEQSHAYTKCSMVIFRLAPQDYHRFHVPISGVVQRQKSIEGTYYSVNPRIVRSSIDVFGENKRKVLYISTSNFGLVAIVFIGATCTGSIKIHQYARNTSLVQGEELGMFQFGGSTIIILVQQKRIQFLDTFLQNSQSKHESIVDVGEFIGRATK